MTRAIKEIQVRLAHKVFKVSKVRRDKRVMHLHILISQLSNLPRLKVKKAILERRVLKATPVLKVLKVKKAI